MTPEHQAFLNAIIANPDDPVPRLVFADYLEESGEPALIARAQFIRGQIYGTVPSEIAGFTADEKMNSLKQMFHDEAKQVFAPFEGAIEYANHSNGFLESLSTSWESVMSAEFNSLLKVTPLKWLIISSVQNTERIRAIDRQDDVDEWLFANQQMGYWPRQKLFFPSLTNLTWQPTDRRSCDLMIPLSVIWKVVDAPRLTYLEVNSPDLDENLMTWLLANWAESRLSHTVLRLAFKQTPLSGRVASTLCSAPGFDRVREFIFAEQAFSRSVREQLAQRFGKRLKYYWRS